MDLNLRVLKEPRGFIRVVQFVLSIFAFATTAGYSGTTSFSFICKERDYSTNVTIEFGYPFKTFATTTAILKTCETETAKYYNLGYSFASSAEFFVTTGVLAFLYTLIIIAFYIFMNQMYTNNQLVPIADLAASGVLSLFWIAGSSAWSQGVSDVKFYTDPKFIMDDFAPCKVKGVCQINSAPNFATLNVSLIFGFANFLLWVASLWFVYKETVFHLQRQQGQIPPPQQQVHIPPQNTQSPQSPQGYKY